MSGVIIAHVSDLHVGLVYFVPEWAENLRKLLERERPDILVITGDLTDDGYLHEYERAKEYVDSLERDKLVIVPGNHDSRNEGFLLFEEMFGSRNPVLETGDIVILGIDSSKPDIDDGEIGRGKYNLIREKFSAQDKFKILALHHHLIPIPGTGRERNIPADAGDVLKLLVELKTNVVLSGHKHKPWVWNLDGTYFITAGTATTRRLKGRSYPSFNLLEMRDDGSVVLKEVNVRDMREEHESVLRFPDRGS